MQSLSGYKQQLADYKQQFDALKPFDRMYAKNIDSRLSMKLTYHSNAIEGNTLTEMETKMVVEDKISIVGKTLVEIDEARNHAKALEYIKQLAQTIHIADIDEKIICTIHAIILTNIADMYAGIYRTVPVRITGSQTVLPNYVKIPDLMRDFVLLFVDTDKDTVDIACDAHYQLVTIHPFVDGNGRTARLLFNLILLIGGFPLTIIEITDRKTYLSALEKGQTTGDMEDYYRCMYQAIIRSLRIYIDDATCA